MRALCDCARSTAGRQWVTQLRLGAADAELRFADDFTVIFEGPIGVVSAVTAPVVPYTLDGVALLLPLLNGEVTPVGVSNDGARRICRAAAAGSSVTALAGAGVHLSRSRSSSGSYS
jgi:hypothetical protein